MAPLELEWDDAVVFGRTRPPSTRPFLFIANQGDATWLDDGGEYWAFVSVFSAVTGERMPNEVVAIGGVGRSYRLSPGERVSVPAALMSELGALAPGQYELEATIPELNLRSRRKAIEL